jgi:hypothetical protein
MQLLLKLSLTGMCRINRIGGAMLCVLTSNAVDREFEPRSGHTKIPQNVHQLLLPYACHIKESELIRIDSESG